VSYQRSTLKITFDDPEFAGLEIKARRMAIGDVLALAKLSELDRSNLTEAMGAVTDLIATADKYLVAWNMTEGDDEEPVPCTLVGSDPQLALTVIMGMVQANVEMPANLRNGSASGQQYLEESIPMATSFGDPIL